MAERTHSTLRITRAVRVRQDAPAEATPAPARKPGNYELLERRSRELEEQHARGRLGTSQPPDPPAPLLFPKTRTRVGAEARQEDKHTPTARPLGIAVPCGLGRM